MKCPVVQPTSFLMSSHDPPPPPLVDFLILELELEEGEVPKSNSPQEEKAAEEEGFSPERDITGRRDYIEEEANKTKTTPPLGRGGETHLCL